MSLGVTNHAWAAALWSLVVCFSLTSPFLFPSRPDADNQISKLVTTPEVLLRYVVI